jgi:branched-chain amino acid transport system permease protein
MLQLGKVPGTLWLMAALAVAAAVLDAVDALRRGLPAAVLARNVARTLIAPAVVVAFTIWAAPQKFSLLVQSAISVAIVTLLGPLVYAEGFRNPSFWDERFRLGPLTLSGQTVIIFAVAIVLILGLFLFFERTLRGKALRATAVNRLGARLMGISTTGAGKLSFGLAAFIGALSGLLIGPTTTVFYDSGFLIGLKGFVAAIFGGLASYPAAAVGALMVGILESFSSFYASAFKEVIVFTVVIPVLAWLSIKHGHDEEEE